MFHFIPKWPNLFWNTFSVTSVDLSFNKWQFVYSALIIITCIYNCYVTPTIVCLLEGNCDSSLSGVIKGLFLRVVASTCLISRFAIIIKGNDNLVQYKRNLEKFHIFTPMTHCEIKLLNKLSSQLVICCLLLTIPVNVLRMWSLFFRSNFAVISFMLMYVQNLSMYCIETHFTILCYVLYQKFVGINRDLTALKIDTVMRNKYPFISQTATGERHGINRKTVEYNGEILNSLIAGNSMTNFVEELKIKHRLVREAVKNLNDLFGIPLGLSVCSLCLYAMFDLYYHMIGAMNPSKSKILIYGWMLQYTVRFGTVTILSHLTTKQVIIKDFFRSHDEVHKPKLIKNNIFSPFNTLI